MLYPKDVTKEDIYLCFCEPDRGHFSAMSLAFRESSPGFVPSPVHTRTPHTGADLFAQGSEVIPLTTEEHLRLRKKYLTVLEEGHGVEIEDDAETETAAGGSAAFMFDYEGNQQNEPERERM